MLRCLSVPDAIATIPTLHDSIETLRAFVNDEEEQFLAVRALRLLERQDRGQHAQDEPTGWRVRGLLEEREPTFDWVVFTDIMSNLLMHAILHSFDAMQPLLQRLPRQQQQTLGMAFDNRYLDALQRMQQRPIDEAVLQRAQPNQSWFSILERTNSLPIDNDLVDVRQRFGGDNWGADQQAQQVKTDAFRSRHQRAARERELRLEIKRVTTELKQQRLTRARKSSLQRELTRLSNEKRMLESEDALLMRRTRRYRLKPSVDQAAKLKKIMHACRYTYNKCVEYRRKLGTANKRVLEKLFVTHQDEGNDLAYPEDMGLSPEWVVSTPASMRQVVVHRFVSAVSAAHTNLSHGNITHFNMRFKGRKQHNYFTFSSKAQDTYLNAQVHRPNTHHPGPAPYPDGGRKPRKLTQFLTITSVPNIPIIAEEGTAVGGEVVILYKHGYWYAEIPYIAEPKLEKDKGRCTACDPGLKAFLTCMDLQGNFTHIGRANWGKLDRLRKRQSAAQRGMSAFANVKKVRKHTGENWKRYVAARREFSCASAKLDNYIKDLHFQAAAYLCKNSDVILLPKFDSKSMLLTSAPWTHKFNSHMQTLAHFQFRQRLLAECAVLGKTLVLCSEMYTSRTCGRCNRLHLSLRNQDMFVCPHCGFVANRDENAAFNIMRFVCAGSLSVFQVNGEQQQ